MKTILKLENLIYAAIFLLPTYLLRFGIFGVPTNALEILIGIILLFWLIRRRKDVLQRVSTGIIPRKYFLPISLLLGGIILSALTNSDPEKSFGIIKGWFLVPLIFTLVAADIIESKKIKNVFWAYYLSAFFVALISSVFLFLEKLTYDLRLEAFFNSPNYLAMYLAPGIIIGVFMIFSSENNTGRNGFLTRSAYFASLLILLVALYFTYSYASWLAVFASSSIICWLNYKTQGALCLPAEQATKPAPAYFKKILLVGIILMLLFFTQIKNDKFKNLINSNEKSSLASRVMIWQSAEKILKDNWLLGIGPGNFQKNYLSYQKYFPPYLEWAAPHPHNLFLAFWLSGGILGISGFLGIILFFFQDILKNKNPERFIAFGIMLYILLHGLVDTTYFKNDLAIVFWLNFLMVLKK